MHWADEDEDCQDARQEVPTVERLVEVTFESARMCQVETGRWYGAFTGTYVESPGRPGRRPPGPAQERSPIRRLEMGAVPEGGICQLPGLRGPSHRCNGPGEP